jgi:precorrin-6B methylase 1
VSNHPTAKVGFTLVCFATILQESIQFHRENIEIEKKKSVLQTDLSFEPNKIATLFFTPSVQIK